MLIGERNGHYVVIAAVPAGAPDEYIVTARDESRHEGEHIAYVTWRAYPHGNAVTGGLLCSGGHYHLGRRTALLDMLHRAGMLTKDGVDLKEVSVTPAEYWPS